MATDAATIADKAIMNGDLQHEVRLGSFFANMKGEAKKTNRTKGGQIAWKLSGKPIDVFNEFKTAGRSQMLIPVLGRLKGKGKQGKQQLAGNESEHNFFWQSVFVNLKRQAALDLDPVDREKFAWTDITGASKDEITEWWQDYKDFDYAHALYNGFSYHITTATGSGGLGITKRYNPNIWGYDGSNHDFSETPDFSYTASTYLSNIIDAFQTIDGNSASVMETRTLEAIEARLQYSRIKGYKIGSQEFYPLVLHSLQARELRADSVWQAAQGRAGGIGKENPIFNGAIGTWGSLVIFVNDKVARLPYYQDASGHTLNFFDYDKGSDDSSNDRYSLAQYPPATVGTTQNVACAVLLGAGALSEGVYSDLEYKLKTEEDYGMVSGVAGQSYYGIARNDAYNEDLGGSTAPTDKLPAQSAIIATYVSQ